jgi:hypothetical protein
VRLYTLLLGVLGVWRVAYLLHAEDGPGNVFARVRRRLEAGAFAAVIGCFYCLSVWVAAPFALLAANIVQAGWPETFLLWPALSAGAIVIERLTTDATAVSVSYQEDHDPNREEH